MSCNTACRSPGSSRRMMRGSSLSLKYRYWPKVSLLGGVSEMTKVSASCACSFTSSRISRAPSPSATNRSAASLIFSLIVLLLLVLWWAQQCLGVEFLDQPPGSLPSLLVGVGQDVEGAGEPPYLLHLLLVGMGAPDGSGAVAERR